MIVRIFIAVFTSLVGGLAYITGLARLMTAFLLGFSAFCAIGLGVIFSLPEKSKGYLFFPVFEKAQAWPYFAVGVVLLLMIAPLFLLKSRPAPAVEVSATHYKTFVAAIATYLVSLFGSSVYWFPSDALRRSADAATLGSEVLVGTCLFLGGVTLSCYLFHRASRGGSERHPDLMRRFVLGFFAFFQMDKVPVLVTYLLIYSPETGVIFPHLAALALAAAIPIGIFLVKTTLDSQEL
jgi:hypothetical protein